MADDLIRDRPISVIGLWAGEPVGKAAWQALEEADVIVGGQRHLGSSSLVRKRIPIEGDVNKVLDAIANEAGRVCVISSGDPGFFGMVRSLSERFGPDRLEVHPAPSSVSMAFARIGRGWDDAVVVSAHGRPLSDALDVLSLAHKAAVLTSPTNPPEVIGQALMERPSHKFRHAIVCSRLGEPDESVSHCTLDQLSRGRWDPLSVVLLLEHAHSGDNRSLAWGLPETSFAHRDGMITKAEVRAIALSKLRLPSTGVLWDVGAGSGSVAIECASLSPGLTVIAIERDPDDARRISENAERHGVKVKVVVGEAPSVLDTLPKPDRAFIGGGGIGVLDAVLNKFDPQTPNSVVATYTSIERGLQARRRLGSMVQVAISRVEDLAGEPRLVANNPVFVTWGPKGQPS